VTAGVVPTDASRNQRVRPVDQSRSSCDQRPTVVRAPGVRAPHQMPRIYFFPIHGARREVRKEVSHEPLISYQGKGIYRLKIFTPVALSFLVRRPARLVRGAQAWASASALRDEQSTPTNE